MNQEEVFNPHVRALRANIFGSTAGVAGVELAAARLLSFIFFNFSPYAVRTAEKFCEPFSKRK